MAKPVMNPLVSRRVDRDVQDHRGRARWRHAPEAGDLQLRQRLRAERRDVATHTGTRVEQSGRVQRHVVTAASAARGRSMRTGPVEYAEPDRVAAVDDDVRPVGPVRQTAAVPVERVAVRQPTAIVPTLVPFQPPSSVVTKTSAVPATRRGEGDRDRCPTRTRHRRPGECRRA